MGNGVLRAEPDDERGRWVLDALGPFGTFAGIVPPVFEAAVRILHPADFRDGTPVRWRDVAAREGTVLHPLAQWHSIAGEHPDADGPPRAGVLPLDELAAIADVLARCTATPEACLAAFWEGFGVFSTSTTITFRRIGDDSADPEVDTRPTGLDHPEIAAAASIELPGRESRLLSLDVRALTDPRWARESGFADAHGLTVQTPIALWPEDRAWYLASEVDFDSTVIGGSQALVDGILALAAAGVVEALELPDEVDLTSRGDRVNPRRQ